jgi:hypothetical protein
MLAYYVIRKLRILNFYSTGSYKVERFNSESSLAYFDGGQRTGGEESCVESAPSYSITRLSSTQKTHPNCQCYKLFFPFVTNSLVTSMFVVCKPIHPFSTLLS